MKKNPRGNFLSLSSIFISHKTAIFFLLLVILFAVIGTIVPQESFYPADEFRKWQNTSPGAAGFSVKFGLTRLFSSAPFLLTVTCLLLSLSICTFRRILRLTRVSFPVVPGRDTLNTYDTSMTLSLPSFSDTQWAEIQDVFARRNFHIQNTVNDGNICFIASKGRLGKWGSILFHLSFIVLLAGVLVSIWTRFEGKILITEGQTVTGKLEEFRSLQSKPFADTGTFGFTFGLEELIKSKNPQQKGDVSRVTISDTAGNRKKLAISNFHAASYKGYTFYQKERGYSPSFTLGETNGRVVFQSTVAMNSQEIDGKRHYQDMFVVPGIGHTIQIQLYPKGLNDTESPEGKPVQSGKPVVELTVTENVDILYSGILSLKEKAIFGGYVVSFDDLRHWSRFRVVKDSGIPILYASFFLGIFGFFLRLLFRGEKIWVLAVQSSAENKTTENDRTDHTDKSSKVMIFGMAEREKTFFRDVFQSIIKEIQTGQQGANARQ